MPSQRNRTGPKPKSLAERFWPKVQKTDACWLWTAYRLPNGYGVIGKGSKYGGMFYAHRVSWEFHYGLIPKGMSVCHTCDTPACVRPDHLFLGSQADNMQDAASKGRVRKGAGHWNVLMTEAKVREVHRFWDEGWTVQAIADHFGVTKGCINDIGYGKTWKHLAIPHASRPVGPRSKTS